MFNRHAAVPEELSFLTKQEWEQVCEYRFKVYCDDKKRKDNNPDYGNGLLLAIHEYDDEDGWEYLVAAFKNDNSLKDYREDKIKKWCALFDVDINKIYWKYIPLNQIYGYQELITNGKRPFNG